jgi:predicted ester cyclase
MDKPLLRAALAVLLMSAPARLSAEAPERVVRQFLAEVRSGRNPDAADRYFAPVVQAHQVTSEGVATVPRSPANYAEHVRQFLTLFGKFEFEVEELIASGDRVFVRWRQEGCHCGSIAGEAPSGKPLIELSSVVYRVSGSKIVEYWIQTDRKGLEVQLQRIGEGPSRE